MNIAPQLTISDVLIVLQFLGMVAMALWVRPLRDAKKQAAESKEAVAKLRDEIARSDVGQIRKEVDTHAARLDEIESHTGSCPAMLARDYVSIARLGESETRRDTQLNLINSKQDAAAVAIAEVRTLTQAIDKAVATIFQLWNDEHRRLGS